MKQQTIPYTQDNQFFLTRVKDTHEEGGMRFITIYARLIKGQCTNDLSAYQPGSESVWVYIDEVIEEGAPSKMRDLPNGALTYAVTPEVVQEILKISEDRPQELWSITPFHSASYFRAFKTGDG